MADELKEWLDFRSPKSYPGPVILSRRDISICHILDEGETTLAGKMFDCFLSSTDVAVHQVQAKLEEAAHDNRGWSRQLRTLLQ